MLKIGLNRAFPLNQWDVLFNKSFYYVEFIYSTY